MKKHHMVKKVDERSSDDEKLKGRRETGASSARWRLALYQRWQDPRMVFHQDISLQSELTRAISHPFGFLRYSPRQYATGSRDTSFPIKTKWHF
ncbi:hypothetical protein M9H77_07172 [Catharanthus roseus]|uniref:Uncharacterized protein n=1 Tax=Catharanthus roseus TaxID=4058 RepID=A0ACC0BU63_CATRO|nr:hypothetical protein M9H77_07172 [Catharanthus roseus]